MRPSVQGGGALTASILISGLASLSAAGDGATGGGAGGSTDDLTVTRFMVFVPAKDFELSKRFYVALGADLVDDGADYAEFRWGDDRFIVRDQYHPQWAENFGIHIIVKDADAFARRARALVASREFPGVRMEGPKDEPWRYRVTYVWDPSGVSLRFSEPMK